MFGGEHFWEKFGIKLKENPFPEDNSSQGIMPFSNILSSWRVKKTFMITNRPQKKKQQTGTIPHSKLVFQILSGVIFKQ